jgi:Ca-activated chloride channel family protein
MLVDCSGSMAGDSIKAARSALERIVHGLEKSDKFSLSRFGTSVEHRSRSMWSGTSQAQASAQRWMEKLQADMNCTEMAEALLSTIAIHHAGSSDILLITDGEIEDIDGVIDVATKSSHRVFVVAIGASPAEAHLRRLAEATGGACDFVAPGENVEPVVLRMFSRLRSMRMNNLRIEWPSMWKIGRKVHPIRSLTMMRSIFLRSLPGLTLKLNRQNSGAVLMALKMNA